MRASVHVDLPGYTKEGVKLPNTCLKWRTDNYLLFRDARIRARWPARQHEGGTEAP